MVNQSRLGSDSLNYRQSGMENNTSFRVLEIDESTSQDAYGERTDKILNKKQWQR